MKKFKGNLKYIIVVIIVLIIIPIGGAKIFSERASYKLGNSYLDAGRYDKAIVEFTKISNYKDVKEKIKDAKYRKAVTFMDNYSFKNALKAFKEVPQNYKDTNDKIKETHYRYGLYLIEHEEYKNAIHQLEVIKDYKDSKEKLSELASKIK